MSIIISETKNGRAFPHNVFICNDEVDFIERINAQAHQDRSDSAGEIETVEHAVAYLNEKHAQRTEVIEQADYCEGMCDAVDSCAQRLGWTEVEP
ncbi:MAG: hypothetical protein WC736_14740 [Gallionella sp.]